MPEKKNDVCDQICQAAFVVKKSLGSGLLEANYHKALKIELDFIGIPSVSQVKCEGFHREISCGPYFVDLLVAGSVVVELKSCSFISKKHMAQTYNYMKLTGCEEGLIINFGESPVGIRRLKDRGK